MQKNYIKYPEALRFQCEMFSNGYYNSPRIMRLVECIFDLKKTIPQWWKDLKAAEGQLIKGWKKTMVEMFEINNFCVNQEAMKGQIMKNTRNKKQYVVVQYEATDREDIFDDFATFEEAKNFIKTESRYEESLSIMKRLDDGTRTTEF